MISLIAATPQAIKSWIDHFRVNRTQLLFDLSKTVKSEIDTIQRKLKETEAKENQRLAGLSLQQLICETLPPQADVRLITHAPKPLSPEEQEKQHNLSRLIGAKVSRDIVKSPQHKQELVDAFAALKNDPGRFQQLAEHFVSQAPYVPRYLCQILEEIEWPSEELKQKLIPELMAMIIHQNGMIDRQSGPTIQGSNKIVGPNRLFETYRMLLITKKIFGTGDFTTNPRPLSPYLAKGIGLLLKDYGECCLEEMKKQLNEGKPKKDIKVGFELAIMQFVECRFPASMLSPLLPYLADVPGIVALQLSDVGVRNPWDAVVPGDSKNGFGDSDAPHLLAIFRNHPYLIGDVMINVDGMSEPVKKQFMKDWDDITKNADRLKAPHELMLEHVKK